MFIKFISSFLVLGMVASPMSFAASTRVANTKNFNKVNVVLTKAVNAITEGKGTITVAKLRQKLRARMAPEQFKEIDAKLAKAPQTAQVKFTVKGSEVKYTSSFESGWLRINNDQKKFIQFKGGRDVSVDEIKRAFKPSGPVTYQMPSFLQYVANLIIPEARAFELFGIEFSLGGIILGAVAAIAVPMILDQLGIYDFNHDESKKHWIGWWDDCNDGAGDADCDAAEAREDVDPPPAYPVQSAEQ